MNDYGDKSQYYSELDMAILMQQREANRPTRCVSPDTVVYCEDCGVRIPEKRLKAVPHTTRCVQCQQEAEQRYNGA